VGAIEMLGGFTAIDVKGAGIVAVVVPLMPFDAAVIVVVPKCTPVANPPVLMLALAGVEEVQVAELVRSLVGPLEYVPVALKCCVTPTARVGVAGVTAID